MGPRQHQYEGQNVASHVSRYDAGTTAQAGKTIDEVRLPSPWSHPQKQEAGLREDISCCFKLEVSAGWHWPCLILLAAAAALPQANSRAADEWPIRDITFYVPYAPGGSTDPISRKFSELLEKQLKVKVIVENKPGASATIGAGAVIRAPPDGYTIGLGLSSSLAYQPLEMKGLAWKCANGYQSMVKLADLPAIIACRPKHAGRPSMIFSTKPKKTRAN